MDRQIIYPGQIPLETDQLSQNRASMLALGKLIAAVLGTGNVVNGLTVAPNSPAALNVVVSPGEIYSLQNIDGAAYSSLPADTTHTCMKQGISLDATTLNCAAPTTAGFSINYLIEATFQEVDGAAVVLPYYNASNPTQAYSGPANSGAAQATVRQGKVVLQAKAGIAATTGTQTTPAADAGYVGLAVVTVANGQATIVAGNIASIISSQVIGQSLLAQIYASRQQSFTTNGSFTVPAGVTTVYVSGCGGGGGGAGAGGTGASLGTAGGGAGGGAGQFAYRIPIAVTPGQVISVTIGAGGTHSNGGAAGTSATDAGNGGATSFGSLLTLAGGNGGSKGSFGVVGSASGGIGGIGFPNGGWGVDGSPNGGAAGGGQGASTPFGFAPGTVRSALGSGLTAPAGAGFGCGGGGGSAAWNGANAPGGAGADGRPGFLGVEW